MKKRLLPALLISALLTFTLCALAACGGSGSSGSSASSSAPAAKATEFSFFSVVVPDGYTANEKQHYVSANPGGSMAVSVHNVSADELLETELKDSDFKEGDTLTAGSFTWKAATSDKWNSWLAPSSSPTKSPHSSVHGANLPTFSRWSATTYTGWRSRSRLPSSCSNSMR